MYKIIIGSLLVSSLILGNDTKLKNVEKSNIAERFKSSSLKKYYINKYGEKEGEEKYHKYLEQEEEYQNSERKDFNFNNLIHSIKNTGIIEDKKIRNNFNKELLKIEITKGKKGRYKVKLIDKNNQNYIFYYDNKK